VSAEKARAKCAKIGALQLEATAENIDTICKSEVPASWHFINCHLTTGSWRENIASYLYQRSLIRRAIKKSV
jgi:hypothetical protein